MNRKQKRLVRLIAIVLAILLGAGAVISAVFSLAYAEENIPAANNKCELTMEYLGEEQALRMSQRLVYTNTSGRKLDRVVFYAPANLFRRQASLIYDADELASAFPGGYLPGGIELVDVLVNDESCEWGFQGTDEAYLRAACSLDAGESCTFTFNYYLLLTENAAFLGVSENDWRLSSFYFIPASLDANDEFILNMPLSFTRWVDAPAMDFDASILLPKACNLSATGTETSIPDENGNLQWTISAQNARDFSMVFTTGFKESTDETSSGVQLRCLSSMRGASEKVLDAARDAIAICEGWLGEFPARQLDFVQSGYGLGANGHTACLWLPQSLLKEGGWELEHAVRVFIANQYFGCRAWAYPSADAWLSDSISEYLAYLMIEEKSGYEAYISALNENIVTSLQLTIPGGLTVTSDASLFTAYEYDIVVRDRGAAVFHELYTAMGKQDLIAALKLFYEMGLEKDVLSEIDLSDSLEKASGRSWKNYLTDWLFNIGDYVNQDIYWLE